MKPLVQETFAGWLDRTYPLTGNPGSMPANLWFALRARTSPERYDIAGATDLVPAPRKVSIDFAGEAHAMGGFGASTVLSKRHCRVAGGRTAHWCCVSRPMTQPVARRMS